MFHATATLALRLLNRPALRIWGKARWERDWHAIDVFATHRRNADSHWPAPFWRGTCITWTANAVGVGWDFAEQLVWEQCEWPASREHPLAVTDGRLRGRNTPPTASEVTAHECGHTGQARRLGPLYWAVGGTFTLFREGKGWVHAFENQASRDGLFGGIVTGSVCERLAAGIGDRRPPWAREEG